MPARLPLAVLLLAMACKNETKSAPDRPEPTPPARPSTAEDTEPEADLTEEIEAFVPVKLTTDVSDLPKSERKALEELIAAAKLMGPIFDRQAWANNPELEEKLRKDTSKAGKQRYEYFRIMRGPWDRQEHFEPFAIDRPRPKGAGFYPEDLTAEDFRTWIEKHPEDEASFESLYTVIVRDGEELEAEPYHEVYRKWLEPAAEYLRAAAEATKNESLAKFLRARADAFLDDEYYESDKLWMDVDSRVGITIGPYETYEDELLGLKASYEAFVTVSDPEASRRLEKFKRHLPAMEQNLPVPDEVKTERGRESPIRVVDLVFSAGDARKSVQTIAFNLPNDERVRKEKGAKKVLLRNSIQTKFDAIMKPIGEKIMAPKFHDGLSGDAFFNEVLFHELSHSLGPAFVGKGEDKVEVRVALGASYTALEECKADVMGAYNILYMIDEGEMPQAMRRKLLVSYFAGLFRSVRFGVAEAHGQGAAVQINRYLEDGSATFDEKAGTFSIDEAKLEQSITKLVKDLVMLQHRGEKQEAEAFLAQYGKMSPPMETALGRLGGIPIDIRPIYPLAGETEPR